MVLKVRYSTQFKYVVQLLAKKTLPAKYKDYYLTGNYKSLIKL